MWIFIIILMFIVLFPVIFMGANQRNKKIFSKIYMMISFALLVIVSGCRGLAIGTDTWMFVSAFRKMRTFSLAMKWYSDRFELGYRIYNAIIHIFSDNPHTLLLVTAIITMLLVYIFFYKKSKNMPLSIILFVTLMYYCNSMCLMRQYLAVVIGCIGIMYLSDNKVVKFFIAVIIATLFHSSAIVLLVLFPLSKLKINSTNRIKLIILSAIVILCSNYLITLLIKILPQYSGYLGSDKYYLQNQIGSILKAVLSVVFFFIINCYYKAEKEESSINRIGYICALIAACISILSIKGAILSRMGVYFSVVNCITLPNIIEKIPIVRDKKIVSYSIVFVGIIYYLVILIYRPYWSGVLPYVFWS